MEKVGTQVRLPLGSAFQIAVQGIRIRLGRSLVTVSGVVLGIAFLMSNVTAQLIKSAIARERESRQTLNLMEAMVRSEVGSLDGKTIGVAVFGAMSDAERMLLARLAADRPAQMRALNASGPGMTSVEPAALGPGSSLLIVLGSDRSCPLDLPAAVQGMKQKVVLDSVAGRVYASGPPAGTRVEVFFGAESGERIAKARKAAEQARFRTLWIAVISVLVTVIGVSNALLMSVTERFKEIGTMKCLGALSEFIRRLFLIESALIGLAGSVLGMAAGAALPIVAFGFSFGFGVVLGQLHYGWLLAAAAGSVAVGTFMAMLAAIYPANFAARMVPAAALRTNV